VGGNILFLEESAMARKRILTLRKGYEGPHWDVGVCASSGDNPPPWNNLDELGKRFLRDKARLEEQFNIISNSDLARQHKIDQLELLRTEVLKLYEDYQRMVVENQNQLYAEELQEITHLQEVAEALRQQEDRLRSVRFETSSADTTAAANTAEAQRLALEQEKMECVEKLKLQIEQAERQRQEIMQNRMSNL